MNFIRCFTLFVAILLSTVPVHAGTDPIGWSITGSVPTTSQLNQSYSVNFTLTNNMPIKMPTALQISNNSTPSTEVTMVDGCSGLTLAPKQSCTVGLVLIPKTSGIKQLSVYMEYGKNKVQIPQPALKTTTAAAGTSLLQGVVSAGFPTAILSSTTYTLSFTFTNNSTSPFTNLTVSQTAGNSAGYTQTSTNCTSSLAASASCSVNGSFSTSASSGDVHVGYTATAGSLSASPVTSTIVNNSTGQAVRTFTIINQCSQDVWFGFVGGAVKNIASCASDADCSAGSTCDPAANGGSGLCFYNDPVPTGGSYLLTHGSSATVPITDYNLQYVWSGNVAARWGGTCATGTCDSADCGSGGGNNACPVGGSFAQPATLSEFTLQRNTVDSYDISILNGTNVPSEITPSANGSPFNPNGITPSEYNCGIPGNPTAVGSLGACSWAFTPPAFPNSDSATSYVYVKPRTTDPRSCTADTDCTSHPVSGFNTCGLNFNKTTTTLSKVCGSLLGYNTANQVCSFANTNQNVPNAGNNPGDTYFPCDSAVSGGTGNLAGFTNWALYACKAQANGALGTCYNTSANPPASTADCCGCVDWQNLSSLGIIVPSDTIACVNNDTAWGGTPPSSISGLVLPGLEWVKKACPTAYSYPFDDKASGFACDNIQGSHTVNTVNYTITFCAT